MPDESHNTAAVLFDEHLARLERGEAADLGTVCSQYPEHADELQRLDRGMRLLQRAANEHPVSLFRPPEEDAKAILGHQHVTEGRVLGDFRLVRCIGRGGMGEVWEAEQTSLSRRVALKVLLPERVDTRGLDFFAREARAGGKLAHPGIVAVYGTGETEGVHWIAMELVQENCDLGHALDGWREAGEVGAEYYAHVAEFVADLAEALEAAHAAGVIHRDLKPSNVLVTPDDHPKLTDFGLAKLIHEQSLSVAGEIAGTYYYMSPEQVAAKRAGIDHRTDIFSLGVVLYEMLTLVRPFSGDTSEQVVRKILWEEALDPCNVRSRTPRDLAVICGKAMEKEPGQRYQSMAELAADLRRHLTNEPILARPSGASIRLRKWVRRNPTRATAIGLLAVALVVVLNLYSKLFDEQQATAEALTTASEERDLKSDALLQIQREQQATQAALEQVSQEKEATTAALLTAQQRADELQQVSNFQAEQLSSVDPEAMGLAIQRMVLESALASGEQAGREAEVLDAEQAELASLLANNDFTGIALGVLDEQVFEGALKALEGFEDQPLVQALLLQTVADTLRELGLLERAFNPQEQAVEIRRRELGDEHPDTLNSINSLGALLDGQGNLDEAEPLLREALEISRRELGNGHPSTLTSINNLGLLLYSQGKLDEAEQLLREGLEVNRRELGNEHLNTLTSINNLGMLLLAQGNRDEAEPLFREALEVRRRTLGDEHPSTLDSINNLGILLQKQGKLDEAEQLLRETLEVRRRKLGNEHPTTLTSINNLGDLLGGQGKLAEAEPLLRESLEVRRRELGNEHPDTLASLNNLGDLLGGQGKLAEAEPLLRESLEVSRRELGDEHPTTLAAINNLGILLQEQGKLDEAEPLLREGLEVTRRTLGNEHPTTLTAINNLGLFLHAHGKLAEAESPLREALTGFRRKLGDGHTVTLTSINNLGMLLYKQGRVEEAEPLYRETLAGRRRTLGDEHQQTLISINDLGMLLKAQGKYEEAELLLREVLEVRRRKLGNEHQPTLISINNLGMLLYSLGKLDEAEPLIREVLEGARQLLGDDHPNTLAIKQNLETLLKKKQEADPPPPNPPSEDTGGDNP